MFLHGRPVIRRIVYALVASGLGSASVSAALVNITQLPGVSASQSSTLGGFVAGNALNGDFADFSHTDGDNPANPHTWTLSIPAIVRIKQVDMYNRTSCCGGRLRDITLDTFFGATQLGTSGSPELNDENVLGGGASDFSNGPAVLSHTFFGAGALGTSLRISRAGTTLGGANNDNNRVLSLGEVVASGYVLNNIALNKPATQSSSLDEGSYPTSNATNGSLGDFTHTFNGDANPSLTINLGQLSSIDSIRIHNRESCCGGRLRDIQVQLLGTDGTSVLYTSPILNPNNTLGGGIGNYGVGPADLWLDFYQLLGVPASGQHVRILRTNVTTGSDDTAVLSVGEVQVFAAVPEPATGLLFVLGAGVALGGFRRSRLSAPTAEQFTV